MGKLIVWQSKNDLQENIGLLPCSPVRPGALFIFSGGPGKCLIDFLHKSKVASLSHLPRTTGAGFRRSVSQRLTPVLAEGARGNLYLVQQRFLAALEMTKYIGGMQEV